MDFTENGLRIGVKGSGSESHNVKNHTLLFQNCRFIITGSDLHNVNTQNCKLRIAHMKGSESMFRNFMFRVASSELHNLKTQNMCFRISDSEGRD